MIGENIFRKLKEMYKTGEQFRILFCPYKEEMFDSMETVYIEACKDEETYTTIMPIPYYVLKDGLPIDLKIEFALFQTEFPESLNCNWDCIVIHNQYDQYNNVTRLLLTTMVLKQFCKHLVFIGYGLAGDREITREEAHLPGFKNSDLIVCETEEHARQMQEHLDYYGFKGKAVGWGNPKFDKREIYIPLNWKDTIGDKKVVLLQTSLTPFMRNPHKKLKQIAGILNKYHNSNEILIWRPHPLLEDTINTHFEGNVIEDYNDLKDFAVASPNIIFDDTSNPHLAIEISEEMISDKSSMVSMYEKTGKPITMLEEV